MSYLMVQVYGFGLSEEILGSAIRESGVQPFVATKFAPLPNRFGSESVVRACRFAPTSDKFCFWPDCFN